MAKISFVFAALSLAAVCDLRNRIIPDWLPLLIAGAGLFLPGKSYAEGVFAALPLLIAGVMAGGIGGGDIKVTGACGLTFGFWKTYTGLLTGLVLLCVFHAGRQGIRIMQKKEKMAGEAQAYPFVPFLLLGMLISIRKGV